MSKKQAAQLKNWKKKERFSKDNIQLANKYMERCPASLVIGEMQIKTSRYHLTPIRMGAIPKATNNKCWRGYGEKGILAHCW